VPGTRAPAQVGVRTGGSRFVDPDAGNTLALAADLADNGRRGSLTEIGADMSGRRRRDDGWDDGRLDAQDDRRDPWADDAIGDWGGRDAAPGDATASPAKSSGGAAGAYVRNAPPGGKANKKKTEQKK